MSQKNKTVQDKLNELSAIVSWFQSEDFVLEKAVDQYKNAETLAAEIEEDLTAIKNDIAVVKQRFDEPNE